jgi:Secretion system C-terminal sorting domain
MKPILISLITILSLTAQSQTYPSFGSEIDVSINGLAFDAMEPFISTDGDILFFNNLNDGVNTKLYYATKFNDSTFNIIGEVNGTNQITPPYLDAVADMDSANNFFWTSTRNYPAELDNLFHGTFNAGNVTSIGRVHGDFNKNIVGWLVMDHGISLNGQYLYYNNARFDGVCQGACETEFGIAQKVNDSTFNQIPNSNYILQNINNTDYIYYAPCISSDDLELYYTRYPRDTITAGTLFEICVAVRSSPTDTFSIPTVLFSELISDLIEAPTLTTDKQIIYYHRKTAGSHKIVMRYRENPLGNVTLTEEEMPITIYPNPTNGNLNIKTEIKYQNIKLSILTLLGKEVLAATNQTQIDFNSIPSGTYFLKIEIDGKTKIKKILKIE